MSALRRWRADITLSQMFVFFKLADNETSARHLRGADIDLPLLTSADLTKQKIERETLPSPKPPFFFLHPDRKSGLLLRLSSSLLLDRRRIRGLLRDRLSSGQPSSSPSPKRNKKTISFFYSVLLSFWSHDARANTIFMIGKLLN